MADISLFFFGSYIIYLSYFIFGKFLHQLFFEKNNIISVKETTLLGLIIISIFGLILNFFYPLNQFLNLYFLFFFILLFFFIKKKNFYNFIIVSLIFCLVLFIVIGFSRNPEDANLYHNSFIALINNEKISFGIANLHFRYGWTSLVQYISALSYIPSVSSHLILIQNNFFYCLIILILFDYFKKDFLNEDYFFASFSLLSILYIVLKFSKYSDWGIDLIPAILTFYLTLLSFKIFSKNKNYFLKLYPFFLLIIFFIFFNRTTYVFIFLLPLVFLLKKDLFMKDIFQFNLIIAFSIILMIYLLKNFINTSCLIYPIYFTCIETSWLAFENSDVNVKRIYLSSKAWAMSFSDGNMNLTHEEYISNFNWIKTWLSKHFFKVLEKIFSFYAFVLLCVSFVYLKFKSVSSVKFNVQYSYYYLLIFFFAGSIFWFLNSPLFRYGSGFLIVLSILIINPFVASILSKLRKNFIKTKNYFIIFFIIILSIKNFTRFNNDKENEFLPYTLNDTNINLINISNNNIYYYNNYQMCFYPKNSPCVKDDISHIDKVKKKLGYKFYISTSN